jgi:hypothetical protein
MGLKPRLLGGSNPRLKAGVITNPSMENDNVLRAYIQTCWIRFITPAFRLGECAMVFVFEEKTRE